MTRLFVLILSSALVLSTTAHAGERSRRGADRDTNGASRIEPRPEHPDRPDARRVELELLGGTTYDRTGLGIYDIAVNGEVLTVEIDADNRQGSLSLYRQDGLSLIHI